MDGRKNYWMKVRRDFFKRHDLRILRAEGGRDAVLFYVELLCESIDHDGRLRYSETKPYTPSRLAMALDYPVEIAKKALDILEDLDLVKTEDDGTLYLPEAQNMTGSETHWAEKKRNQRGQAKDKPRTKKGQSEDKVGKCPTETEIETELEKETETELEIDSSSKPAREEVLKFCEEANLKIDGCRFFDHYEKRKWLIDGNPIRDWQALALIWNRNERHPVEKNEIRFLENEYSKERIEKQEAESLDLLDQLLEE